MVSSLKIFVTHLRVTMITFILLTLSTTNVVYGQNNCNDDSDCSPKQYCYDVSHICVNYTQCDRHNRMEAEEPARQPSQCGPCLPGYIAEILGSQKSEEDLCKFVNVEDFADGNWMTVWTSIGVGSSVIVVLILIYFIKTAKCTAPAMSASGRFFEKVNFLTTRPTAPPQDDPSYHLRGLSYADEEQPPVYASVIRPSVDKEYLVGATMDTPPTWIVKPPYEADYNDNVDDGAAMPIHSSSTALQIDPDGEGETNPSSWTPNQVTVNVPTRPFALFANTEQQDNMMNNVLVRGGNCTSNCHENSSNSDNDSEIPEEASGPRMHAGGMYSGTNVQINQTITLNIASKSGSK